MSSSPFLQDRYTTVRLQVLPAYEPLGLLTMLYLLGSLVHGYTEDADLDLMLVWDAPDVPEPSVREALVARLLWWTTAISILSAM